MGHIDSIDFLMDDLSMQLSLWLINLNTISRTYWYVSFINDN